ncbi:MAG TPA: ribbon-helix-helix protein, CopG family [Candidatus Acidoferrales bacterium]|nr:ribbon-helix-helix protein, CopG family [Candidatus Acidoferrales bacterium]
MPLNKVTIAISDELLAATDRLARSENSSRSKIVAAALEAYVGETREKEGVASDELESLMVPRETVMRLEAELEQQQRELRHKDELLFMKTDMIERLTTQYESFKQAREAEINRYEAIAGFYGSESSKIIDRLADVTEILTRLLPPAPSSDLPHLQANEVGDRIQAPLLGPEEAQPKRSLRELLFGSKPKTEEIKKL